MTPKINNQNFLWKEQGETVTLLILESGKFLEFNAIGSKIWRGLAAGKSSNTIIEDLAKNYPIPRENLAKDMETFIEKMQKAKLLEI